MARTSGKVDITREDLRRNQFVHAKSGIRYQVLREGSAGYFEFSRSVPMKDRFPISGKGRLDYYIGSRAFGRSYLFSTNGFLFQAPISYYSTQGKWDLSPGYERSETIDLARPIEAECLRCHASQIRPVAGTLNRFQVPPFQEDGIGCERCHGPGKLHVEAMRSGSQARSGLIVNPAKLESKRRDSVCAQCHLTGEVQITKAQKSLLEFQPGKLLSDYAISFVWESAKESRLKVHSHYEKLWQSRCKKVSGDKLWCGSCHDPHSLPSKARREDYFRQKCLSCHTSSDCTVSSQVRRESKNDCIACHMPKSQIVGIEHTVYTDHGIPRGAQRDRLPDTPQDMLLAAFGGESTTARELGLAYSKLAAKNPQRVYLDRAFALLKRAVEEKPGDGESSLQLGYLYQIGGNETKAAAYYQLALEFHATKLEAAVNLGTILAKRGDYSAASSLWEDALLQSPSNEVARINLANAYLRQGNRSAAERAMLKALEFQPDFPQAQQLLSDVRSKTRP